MTRDDVPAQYRPMYDRAMSGRSRRAAIKAHCLECCGWQRGEVARCTAPGCPLFQYRPGARSTPAKPLRNPPATRGFGTKAARSPARRPSGARSAEIGPVRAIQGWLAGESQPPIFCPRPPVAQVEPPRAYPACG